jgi:DNA-binding transcriptional LysR family regulator
MFQLRAFERQDRCSIEGGSGHGRHLLRAVIGMTLAQLRYLLAIVDAGLNITLAADRTNATQPGLSKQLKQLESELGLRLFVRRGRNLDSLTDAGRAVVQRARTIMAEVNGITAFAADQRHVATGLLRIETTHIQAQFVLPPALAKLRAQFPHVDISLTLGVDTDSNGVPHPDADFMMFSTDGRTPGRDIAIPLYRWQPVAIMPTGHPLADPAISLTLDMLAAHPLVTYDTSQLAPLSITSTFHDAGLRPRFAYAVRDGVATKAAVRSGLGIGILAEMAVDRDDADLVVRPVGDLFPHCVTWAVLRRDKVLRDYTAHLLAILGGLTPRAVQRAVAGDPIERSLDAIPRWTGASPSLSFVVPNRSAPAGLSLH